MKSAEIQLTILMPCLNEAKTLGACIEKIHAAGKKMGIPYEVLVADNGSTDGSIEIAERLGARVCHVPRKGYGAALRAGFESAKGEYVLFADSDDTYDFRVLPEFWARVQEGHRVVIGSRLRGTIHKGAMPFLNHYLGTPVLTFLIRDLFSLGITDCNSGMRLLHRDEYARLKMVSPGMEFASEMLVKLGLLRVPVCEIPIDLHPDRRGRPPHLRRWRDGWRHLRFILMFAPDRLFSRPGLVAFWVGAFGVTSLTFGPIVTEINKFDYHTQMASMTLGILGLTVWGFGRLIEFFSPIRDFVSGGGKGGFLSWSLESKLLVSLASFLVGLIPFAIVIFRWVRHGFQGISEPNLMLTGQFYVLVSIVLGLLSLTFYTFDYDGGS